MFVRPFFKEMLARLVPLFEICVYTASEKLYADTILDHLDPKHLYFKQRIYREQCSGIKIDSKQVYVKDLRCIRNYDLSQIVIVDNNLLSFSLHVDNGIPISDFFNDPQDRELKHLTEYIVTKIAKAKDIRAVNRAEFKLKSIINLSLQHSGVTSTGPKAKN